MHLHSPCGLFGMSTWSSETLTWLEALSSLLYTPSIPCFSMFQVQYSLDSGNRRVVFVFGPFQIASCHKLLIANCADMCWQTYEETGTVAGCKTSSRFFLVYDFFTTSQVDKILRRRRQDSSPEVDERPKSPPPEADSFGRCSGVDLTSFFRALYFWCRKGQKDLRA